jgi:hypothetical protein
MTLWEERAARNEALFREVNERVEELHDGLANGGTADFVCECADETCTRRITVPLAVYEQTRADPHSFLVAPGHMQQELEHVISEEAGYVVVRKHSPVAARIAEQTDPRA